MVVRSVVMRAFCGLVLAGVLVFALRSGNWRLVAHATLRVGPAALALALAISVLSLVMHGMVWARVLRRLGYPASTRLGLTIYAGTGLASYIGMGAGAFGVAVLLLRRHGVSASRAALLVTIATTIGFCGCLVWAPCGLVLLQAPAAIRALPALGSRVPLVALITIAVCAVGTPIELWLLTLAPRLGARWHLARFVADPADPPIRLYLRHLLGLIPLSALAWLVGSMPLWIVVQAATPRMAVSLAAVIAVQSVAAVIGALVFFLPNGLGARDGVTVALLAGVIGVPMPAAAAAAILVRVNDPLAKALILLLLAILERTRIIARRHSRVHDRLRHSRVAALVHTAWRWRRPSASAVGHGADRDQALPGRQYPVRSTRRPHGRPPHPSLAPGAREEKGRNVA